MIYISTDIAVRLAKARVKFQQARDKHGGMSDQYIEALEEFEGAADAIADDLIARNFHEMTEQIEAQAPRCICTFAQKMVGDGCHVCNPEYAQDHDGHE